MSWKPIDFDRDVLQNDMDASAPINVLLRRLIAAIDARMTSANADEEPDETCPVPGCGKNTMTCPHIYGEIAAAANAKIRALQKKLDEYER